MAALAATCRGVRESLSAALDGEDAAVPADAVGHHLASCRDCRRHARRLEEVARRTRLVATARVPDLSADIVAAVGSRRDGVRERVRDLRAVVALAGAVQLALAVPVLLGLTTMGGHVGRDLAAFELALGVGFLLVAWQPRRSVGVLPVAAVVTGIILVGGAVDVVAGRATLLTELHHLAELVGVAALWALHRRTGPERAALRAVEAA